MRKKTFLASILILIGFFLSIDACIITFINDSSSDIRVQDVKNSVIFDIKKNKSRRFGGAHERTHIKVYTQFKNGIFPLMYDLEQTQCAKSGNPRIKFSDLEKNIGEASLFTIKKNHKKHKPMVQTLPILNEK
jgi:hypothetical protein